MPSATLEDLLTGGRRNATISWALVGVAGLSAISSGLVSGPLWSVFALFVVALAMVPPLVYRSRYVMLPWEVLAMATLPLVGLAVGLQRFTGPLYAYIAVAALGLVIAVELDSFTQIQMSPGFAIVLVVATTMAAAALWAMLNWYADILLDRGFDLTNDELMIEFVWATAAGFVAGLIFWLYFRRQVTPHKRVPEELEKRVIPPEREEVVDDG
jgi:hypothetical protein